MNYKQTTMIPNIFFDTYLKVLSEKEIKVLLIILRQTIGWINNKGIRKNRDRINHGYFIKTTGLTRKSVSQAIAQLVSKGIITAESYTGSELQTGRKRKGKKRIFYSCTFARKVKCSTTQGKIVSITKLIGTKLIEQKNEKGMHKIKKQTDQERYYEIIKSNPDRPQ